MRLLALLLLPLTASAQLAASVKTGSVALPVAFGVLPTGSAATFELAAPGASLETSLAPAPSPSALLLSAPAAFSVAVPVPTVAATPVRASKAALPTALKPTVLAAAKPALRPTAFGALKSAASVDDDRKGPETAASPLFDGAAMKRPLVESWNVEGVTYASTEELLEKLPRADRPLQASYTFSHTTQAEPPRPGANAAIGAVAGGVFSTVGAFILGAVASTVDEFLSVVTFNPDGGASVPEIVYFALGIGVMGVIAGFFMGRTAGKDPQAPSRTLRGRLLRLSGADGEKVVFERYGEFVRSADLGLFSRSPRTTAPAAPAPWPAWKRALTGLGLGAAFGLAYFVPLLNVVAYFVVPGAFATAFAAAAKGTGVHAGWLGGALGMVLSVLAVVVATTATSWLSGAALLAGGVGLIGLLTGWATFDKVRAQGAEDAAYYPEGQWWSGEDR